MRVKALSSSNSLHLYSFSLSSQSFFSCNLLMLHDGFTINHVDPDIIATLFSSSKVRKLLYKTPGLTLSQIGNELSTFLNPLFKPDTPSPFQEWDQNLSAVIKLTNSFRKIDSAACYYKRIRGLPVPLDSQPEAPGSEIKKFLVTMILKRSYWTYSLTVMVPCSTQEHPSWTRRHGRHGRHGKHPNRLSKTLTYHAGDALQISRDTATDELANWVQLYSSRAETLD